MKNKLLAIIIPIVALLVVSTGFYKVEPAGTIKTSDTSFVKLKALSPDFAYDMRYATINNFLKKKVYDCDNCIVRKEVGIALVKANQAFLEKGYRIKLYDCYRPLDVQKKMWEIYPNASYVANPNIRGSIHNRGGAVDMTLVDMNGKELDMGTDFDHFGEEAHHTYLKLDPQVINNRRMLKETMEANGFTSQRTEWWHYNYKGSGSYPLSNFMPSCE